MRKCVFVWYREKSITHGAIIGDVEGQGPIRDNIRKSARSFHQLLAQACDASNQRIVECESDLLSHHRKK